MRTISLCGTSYAALAFACAMVTFASPALAQSVPGDTSGASAPAAPVPPAYYGSVVVAKSEGKLVKLPRPVANLFVADDSIASVRPASPSTIFVFGKTPGETNIVATDQAGNRVAQFSVEVSPSDYAAQRAKQSAPGSGVSVDTEAGGEILSGTVNTPEQADEIYNQAKLAAPSGGAIVNNLTVTEPVQVELKVRIASMSRNVNRALGIDWEALGAHIGGWAITASTASLPATLSSASAGGVIVQNSNGTFEGVIDALASDNLAHVLAEPTLTALSGTQASFQVGGEFPIPVSSGTNGSVTVTFKSYGVLLTFTPTVYADGRIALQVAPEVSSINSANSATLTTGSSQSLTIPSLNVTAASTTVILGSGQGMAIAGLLEDTTNQVDNGVPGLSEVPLLGTLFRGDAFQREQQELVITVTPYLVSPVNNPNSLASPDDGWSPANDLQRILLLRQNGTVANNSQIPGNAGFMVQ